MTVNKDLFESFEAGLFICNKANEAEVCVKEEVLAHMDWQWFEKDCELHFAEKIGTC